MGQNSSVGIATRYGLDGSLLKPQWGARFYALNTGRGDHPMHGQKYIKFCDLNILVFNTKIWKIITGLMVMNFFPPSWLELLVLAEVEYVDQCIQEHLRRFLNASCSSLSGVISPVFKGFNTIIIRLLWLSFNESLDLRLQVICQYIRICNDTRAHWGKSVHFP